MPQDTDNPAQKKPELVVSISPNKMSASLQVKGAAGMVYPDRETLLKSLSDSGVRAGMKDKDVETLIREKIWNTGVTVAEGTAPVDGKDGSVKYLFEINPSFAPKPADRGKVQSKPIYPIQNVAAGTEIAVLVAPEEGKPGMNVCGESVPGKSGKPAALPVGPNTAKHREKPDTLVATVDGHVYLTGKSVQVDSTFTVEGDIDFRTGNFVFKGSLLIKGDVKPGFSVVTGKDVEIGGVVEDSDVKSGGNVVVKGGFLGRGKGHIQAEGSVDIKFCEHQMITAKMDVICSGSLLNARIDTEGAVRVEGKSGVIVGGEIVALKGVLAATIGSEAYTKTTLIVGVHPAKLRRVSELQMLLARNQQNQDNIKKAVQAIGRMQMLKIRIPKEKLDLLEKLKGLDKDLEKEREDLESETRELSQIITEPSKAEVRVTEKVYPGVTIGILRELYKVRKPFQACVFRLNSQGKVVPFSFQGDPLDEPQEVTE